MASVKSKGTKSEINVRKALFKKGLRYRINDKSLPGSPDIVLPKYRIAIFIHGCFWHGHKDCKKAIHVKSNIEFWKIKIEQNRQRDEKSLKELKEMGWEVFTIWECELRNKNTFNDTINLLLEAIAQS